MGNSCLGFKESEGQKAIGSTAISRNKIKEIMHHQDKHGRHDKLYHALHHPTSYNFGEGPVKYQQGFVGQFDLLDSSTSSSEDEFWRDLNNVIPITHFQLPSLSKFFMASDQNALGMGANVAVIKFFRSDCRGSAEVEPFYLSLSSAFPKVVFLEADVLFNKELVANCNVIQTPTFVVFRNGQEVSRLVGVNGDDIHAMITTYAPYIIP